jgi:hypothetical protein
VSDAAQTTGTMLWFDEAKNYGFILTDDGERLYVHRSAAALVCLSSFVSRSVTVSESQLTSCSSPRKSSVVRAGEPQECARPGETPAGQALSASAV